MPTKQGLHKRSRRRQTYQQAMAIAVIKKWEVRGEEDLRSEGEGKIEAARLPRGRNFVLELNSF